MSPCRHPQTGASAFALQEAQPQKLYSPMGAASPSLAEALASQASDLSRQGTTGRTVSRLRNVSMRVPDRFDDPRPACPPPHLPLSAFLKMQNMSQSGSVQCQTCLHLTAVGDLTACLVRSRMRS